jgi:glycine cleavage system H protein
MQKEQWSVPESLYYSRDNYWVKVEGSEALIGLTEYGQSTTGDIIYLELPPVGKEIEKCEEFGSIESGKWVGKLMSPVTGEVIETNPLLETGFNQVNKDPYSKGWLFRVKLQKPEELDNLLDAAAYREWIQEQEQREQEEESTL